TAVLLAVGAMGLVILAYDQLLFRPIVAWGDKFRFEQTASRFRPHSWVYDWWRRGRLIRQIADVAGWLVERVSDLPLPFTRAPRVYVGTAAEKRSVGDWIRSALVFAVAGYVLYRVVLYTRSTLGLDDLATAVKFGFMTLARVIVLIAIASAIWVPIGVWIGTRPRLANMMQPLAQFLAAFPANVLFPMAVVVIVALK